jgi:hypothetical protein
LQVLETFLEDLWETELAFYSKGHSPFCSQTTLEALRIMVLGTIELTDHLLSLRILEYIDYLFLHF